MVFCLPDLTKESIDRKIQKVPMFQDLLKFQLAQIKTNISFNDVPLNACIPQVRSQLTSDVIGYVIQKDQPFAVT